jgi:hypothetical protein
VRITDCENYYNKFVKLYDEKKALLKGTTAEAEWANVCTLSFFFLPNLASGTTRRKFRL